jgi:signal transduction histidine kinase
MSEQSNDFETRRQLLQMEMLYEIGLAINESLDPTYVAEAILHRALTMIDARAGLLLAGNDADPSFAIVGQVGLNIASDDILQLPALTQAWNERQLIQIERDTASGRHLCFVPLESHQQISGLLVFADKEHRDGSVGAFNEHDETLLRAFGHQAGTALHNAQLHHNLKEAYAQLQAAQRQLAQMEQLRALGDLAAEVTHSMSHILGVIIGRADMYFNLAKDPQETMQTIMATAESGQAAIARIQQFTRLGVGKKRVEVHLHELLQQSATDVQALWQQRNGETAPQIEWQIELAPLPITYANPTDLKEVANNLLLNALEAMPEGGTVRLTSRRQDDNLIVEVGDSGTGMDDETRQQIFKPFFSTKEESGNGLGLAIAYRIVVDHEGEIAVDSTLGQGTRFTLRLPLRSEPPPTQEDEDVAADSDH